MKIIKEGKIPTYMGICNICGCEFEADYGEVEEERQHYTYVGDTITYYCKCPCCGTLIAVAKKEDL